MSGDDELAALVALSGIDGFGRARLRAAQQIGAQRSWQRCRRGLEPDGRPSSQGGRWVSTAAAVDPAGRLAEHERAGVLVTRTDSLDSLFWAGDPNVPTLLYWDGLLARREQLHELATRPRVAIVGTRRATRYGLEVACQLGRQLAERGVSVVSGLALGVDGAAHSGALEADGESWPVAVVASGLDHVHPQRNRALWERVRRRGVVVSEHPLGVAPAPWQFPLRNRIVVALSHAVVVVESAERGGSLITASLAGEAGVPVLAVPGPVTSASSVGANRLLADGCAPCLGVDDVLDAIGLRVTSPGRQVVVPDALAPLEQQVYDAIGSDGAEVGAVMEHLEMVTSGMLAPSMAEVAVALVRLQDRGVVRSSGGVFVRVGR